MYERNLSKFSLHGIGSDPTLADPWSVVLRYLCIFVVSSAGVVLGLHWFLVNHIMENGGGTESRKIDMESGSEELSREKKKKLVELI